MEISTVDNAQAVVPTALRFWECVPTTLPSRESRQIDYRPSTQFTNASTIIFNIPGSGALYTDLTKSLLYVSFQILREDGSLPSLEEYVGVCNLTLHALFESIELQLNQKIVHGGEAHYGYKAYLETILGATESEKKTCLQAEGFWPDEPWEMEHLITADDLESSMALRSRAFSAGRIGDLMGKLHLDFFHSPRLLLPGVDIQLKLFPQKPEFLLKYDVSNHRRYKVNIADIFLRLHKVQLEPNLHAAVEENLALRPANYPFLQSGVKALNIPSGSRSFAFEDVLTGIIPSVLIFGIVRSDAFQGDHVYNPFNFENHDISSVSVQVDGRFVGPPEKLEFETTQGLDVTAFRQIFDVFGKNINNGLTRRHFTQGTTVFCYRLADGDDAEEGFTLPVHRHGNLKLSGTFNSPLQQNVVLVVYASYPRNVHIDHNRTVFV